MDVIVISRQELKELVEECLITFFEKGESIEHSPSTCPEKLLNSKEICQFLGITPPTLIRWKKKGKIPFLEEGNIIRFDPAAVTKALEKKIN